MSDLEDPHRGSRGRYAEFRSRKLLWIQALIALCIVVALFSMGMGAYKMSVMEVLTAIFRDTGSVGNVVIWNIRLPRIAAAVLVGSSLAVAGTVMQCILKNPLASPYTLGISGAAAFGAAVAIAIAGTGMLGGTAVGGIVGGMYGMSLFAFGFAMLAVLIVILFSRTASATSESMVLAGVAVGSIFGAGLSSLQYFVDDSTLASIVFWQFGDLSKASWNDLGIVFAVLVPASVYFYLRRMDYNSLEAGGEVAVSLGIDTRRETVVSMTLASVLAAVCVAMVGIIGFVGLLGPHIMRRIVGGDHRYLLPASMVMGTLVLLVADAVGRIPFESPVPVGIVTSFLGGPLFLYILVKKGRRS